MFLWGMYTLMTLYVHFNRFTDLTITSHTNPYNLALSRMCCVWVACGHNHNSLGHNFVHKRTAPKWIDWTYNREFQFTWRITLDPIPCFHLLMFMHRRITRLPKQLIQKLNETVLRNYLVNVKVFKICFGLRLWLQLGDTLRVVYLP